MRVAVLGAGAVGARAARQLASTDAVDRVVIGARGDRAAQIAAAIGPRARAASSIEEATRGADVVVVAVPPGGHRSIVESLLEQGTSAVSTSDAMDDVEALRGLDAEARERGRHVVIGAGFSPGLTCVLAVHAASRFDGVDEVHVARVGTGGPACARQHHRALGGTAVDWRDGAWDRRRGGSGRELCWFPDPVGAADCYRAEVPDALLLAPAFPDAVRVTARVGARRRDRLTAHLPMLRPPHAEGGPGAARVEIRGRRGPGRDAAVLGAVDRPAVAAGAVAALAAVAAADGSLRRPGAAGLAELVDPLPFLTELARRGVKAAVFEGSAAEPG